MMSSDTLPDHPAFLRLGAADRALMMRHAEVWEAPEGAWIYHPGDSGEDLLLVLEGRLESEGNTGPILRWLPGELWGEDRLIHPSPVGCALVAKEKSRWLRWSRNALISLAAGSSRIRRDLWPVRDKTGYLVSGLAEELPGAATGRSGRRLRASMKPVAAALLFIPPASAFLLWAAGLSEVLPPVLPLIAPAVYLGWFLFFLIGRFLCEYRIEADSITSRAFDWSRFAVESRYVPMDQVRGVESDRSGLTRRIFGYGTVIVKTSALEGSLVLRDVGEPEALCRELSGLLSARAARRGGEERESMRRILEQNGVGHKSPRRVDPAPSPNDAGEGEVRFRKSVFVLIRRLLLPLLTAFIPLLGADIIVELLSLTRRIALGMSLVPGLWFLYRLEDWRNDSYRITGGYAVEVYRKPLGLKETRRQVELTAVQNIRTEQNGLSASLFRYGDVILVTAGGASDAVFSGVSRPWKVQETLFRYRERELRRKERARRESRKDELVRFAQAVSQIREG